MLSCLALVCTVLASPAPIKLSFAAQSTDPDVLSLLRFERIEMWDLRFEHPDLSRMHYEIRVKRFLRGKKTLDEVAFDSKELGELGVPKDNALAFRVMSQAKEKKARIDFQFPRWSVQKSYACLESRFDYVMKNFLGASDSMAVAPGKETYVLAYLQPFAKPDGSASYCEVAQSGLDPEQLFQRFKIPCYFLVSVKFQD